MGVLVTVRSPPRFVKSTASLMFSSPVSPLIFLIVASPAMLSNSTRRIPSIATSPLTFDDLMPASSGIISLISLSQSMMVSVSPSGWIPATVPWPSVSTLIACSFQVRTLVAPCQLKMFVGPLNPPYVMLSLFATRRKSLYVLPLPGPVDQVAGQWHRFHWRAASLQVRCRESVVPVVFPGAGRPLLASGEWSRLL